MRRFYKRGMDDKLMFIIWEVIVILMVIIVLALSVRGIANNTAYWKKYHSADMALMTDLMIANDGDFMLNYDLKDLQGNYIANAVKNTLYINPLKFQIFLKERSFLVYDESADKDRFPQSFLFAKDKDVTVIQSNTSNDYIVIYKEENKVGMRTSMISTSIKCPSIDTKSDLNSRRFEVIGQSAETETYGTYITDRLLTVGKGADNEALFALTTSASSSVTIYYEQNNIMSEKMACLLQRQLLKKYPDMNIFSKQYDNSYEVEPFLKERDNYIYWMIISVDTAKISNTDMSTAITEAIQEFYR